MYEQARLQLAPSGTLRVGINMGNPLLVTGKKRDGEPDGVSPDLGRAIARKLGVPVSLVPFAKPSEVAAAVGTNVWDICLIGSEPERAEKIAFTPAYAEIEATYMVPAASAIQRIEEVDRPGIRIVAMGGSAFGLWLERNIQNADLVSAEDLAQSLQTFIDEKLEALAGLRADLSADAKTIPDVRVLGGRFMTVQQAIGTERKNDAGSNFLAAFVEESKTSGFVAELIEKHKAFGLSVASVSACADPQRAD